VASSSEDGGGQTEFTRMRSALSSQVVERMLLLQRNAPQASSISTPGKASSKLTFFSGSSPSSRMASSWLSEKSRSRSPGQVLWNWTK
jgi:hypothetical protein